MTLEISEFLEVYSLAPIYEGVQIIGEREIRTPREHNLEVKKRRENKPKELVLT